MGKPKHSEVMSFLNVSGEADIRTVRKTWEKWIHIIQRQYGKAQTFQSYGFLKYFVLNGNPYNFQTWVKQISKVRENYGKTWTFQIYGFFKYFGLNRNPYNSQNMGKVNSHNTRRVWKKTNILNLWIS